MGSASCNVRALLRSKFDSCRRRHHRLPCPGLGAQRRHRRAARRCPGPCPDAVRDRLTPCRRRREPARWQADPDPAPVPGRPRSSWRPPSHCWWRSRWQWLPCSDWRATRSSRKGQLARQPEKRRSAVIRAEPQRPPARRFHPVAPRRSPSRPRPVGSGSRSPSPSRCPSASSRSRSAQSRSPPGSPDRPRLRRTVSLDRRRTRHVRPAPASGIRTLRWSAGSGAVCLAGGGAGSCHHRRAGWSDHRRLGTDRVRPAGWHRRDRHRGAGRRQGGNTDGGRHGGAGGIDPVERAGVGRATGECASGGGACRGPGGASGRARRRQRGRAGGL
jgi:hypothetical protein